MHFPSLVSNAGTWWKKTMQSKEPLTGLRFHARCHPYPIPQPIKVRHTTGVCDPYSFRIVMWVLICPTRTNQWKCCETGPMVFRPYPRRLESLTICRCHYKAALSSQLFKDPECWSGQGLGPRPPARQTNALPTELTRQKDKAILLFFLRLPSSDQPTFLAFSKNNSFNLKNEHSNSTEKNKNKNMNIFHSILYILLIQICEC